jgi:TPR repeat protein
MERSTLISLRRQLMRAFSAHACVLTFGAMLGAAAEPDIPRIPVDAERLSVKQEIQLGAAYLAGRGVHQNYAQSAYWYERAANAGDPLAQNEIGYFYQTGTGVTQDSARAVQWYQRAADGGFLEARVNLGIAYLWGVGVKKDAQLGYELIHEAAVRNCGLADAYLGEMYYFGIGVPVDHEAARGWYERGARFNDSIAEHQLAALLVDGNPSRKDLLKATKLFRKSIKGGYVPAQHSLGLLLIQHSELAAQPNEAINNLQSASEAGNWKSSVVLGALYRDGKGVPRDHAKAFYYFRLAQLQGGEIARKTVANDLSILSRELTSEQAATLKEQTDEWLKKHPLTLQFVYKDTGSSSEFPVFAISAAKDDTHAGRLIAAPPGKAEP